MLRHRSLRRIPNVAVKAAILGASIAALYSPAAFALITGGEGSEPISDPGWPTGAAAVFNHPTRVAYWVGPPFGGGQWHAECRGDAVALSRVLDDFAKIDAKQNRIVVHDGVGSSFWLNPNGDPNKKADAQIDWRFMVWQQDSWNRLREMPVELVPPDVTAAEDGPPAEIDVWVGDNIRWADVTVPKGVEVIDERLEAHGFSEADGVVVEGTATDAVTKQPVAARMKLERIEPQAKGGYKYTNAAEATANEQGRWVLKNAPAGWYRIVIEGEGYVPRVAGHIRIENEAEPRWQSFSAALARPASVFGRVTDEDGAPLADVDARLGDFVVEDTGRYEASEEYTIKTDDDGRFEFNDVPTGKTTVWIRKSGYCRPGLGPPITTPTKDVRLSMMKSAQLRVSVDFSKTARPADYIIQIEPEGGSKVGSWGGSGSINGENQMIFSDVPPGRYVLEGRPNPSSESEVTEPVTVDLKGGETTEITLSAK
jgi:hypothetical protein